jgi:hypothetical protein
MCLYEYTAQVPKLASDRAESTGGFGIGPRKGVPVKLMHSGATGSVDSLSPLGERVGVRGLRISIDYRESETPHPTPLPTGEGADRASGDVVRLIQRNIR